MYEAPYAEDVNYWKTSRSAPDTWIERATRELEKAGAEVTSEGFGRDAQGRAAYMLAFELGGERFRAVWPVLQSETGNTRAARVQAATMLYHDIKQRCVTSRVLGPRRAFFSYYALPDGRIAGELADPELQQQLPRMLTYQPGQEE